MRFISAIILGSTFTLAACSSSDTTSSTSSTGAGGGASSSTAASTGTTGSAGSSTSTGAGGSAATIDIQSYSSDPSGPAVNSHLLLGPKEAILVDSQFFKADAKKVADLVTASGKTLTTVFLTHAHPDHYLGLDILHAAFPAAKIVATQAVIDDFKVSSPGTFAYLKMNFTDQIADALFTPEPLSGTTLTLDGQTIDVIALAKAGESKTAAALALPGGKTLIAGDLVYDDVHLVLAECASQGWLDNLAAVKAMGFSTVYPGHGAKGDMSLFDADAQYINDVVPILDGAATGDAAKAQIKAKYPGYASDFLLGFSVDNYFMNCKKP